MKKLLVSLLIASVMFGVIYFTAIYQSPQQLQAQFDAQLLKIKSYNDTLALIDEYLSLRNGSRSSEELKDLQESIINASDGLITASVQDYDSFDRQAKALKTVFSIEVTKLTGKAE